ncbi:MAG: hypothetical protein VB142_11260 [Burkholderia sp.]
MIQLSLEQRCKKDRAAVRCSLAAIVRRSLSSAPVPWQSRRNNPARLDPQGLLRATVRRLLRERHSPEQIASIL